MSIPKARTWIDLTTNFTYNEFLDFQVLGGMMRIDQRTILALVKRAVVAAFLLQNGSEFETGDVTITTDKSPYRCTAKRGELYGEATVYLKPMDFGINSVTVSVYITKVGEDTAYELQTPIFRTPEDYVLDTNKLPLLSNFLPQGDSGQQEPA